MTKQNKYFDNFVRILSSRGFFIFVISLFIIQASWLAISAAYPMLYDEYYHPGVIDIYSKQLSPFIDSQTPNQVATYMDITRVPSYLYHYLLSFPYRLISFFTDSFYIKIISLRLINVLMVAIGLVFYRKLFRDIKIKNSIINIGLSILILLPIFPTVAAHINYDNLLFALTPIFFIFSLKLFRGKLTYTNLVLMLTIGMLTSLVKYTFLPIFLTTLLFLLYTLYKKDFSKIYLSVRSSFINTNRYLSIALTILLLLSIGLFIERYAVNLYAYHEIQPGCQHIHDEADCLMQPIIARDSNAKTEFTANPTKLRSLPDFTWQVWLPDMLTGIFSGGANVGAPNSIYKWGTSKYVYIAPIGILLSYAWFTLLVAPFIIGYAWRRLVKTPFYYYFALIIGIYVFAVLVYTNYSSYRSTGIAAAIQSRYFLLLSPILTVFFTQAVNVSIKSKKIKLIAFVLTLLIFTQGGGVFTYIVRSGDGWYWQKQEIIIINRNIKKSLLPIINE